MVDEEIRKKVEEFIQREVVKRQRRSNWVTGALTLVAAVSCAYCLRTSIELTNLRRESREPNNLRPLPLLTRNVIGSDAPEQFYQFGDQRVYLSVDGQPVESYFSE